MSGTLAQTIQGEASDPAGQFAVATTIYNRAQAGSFPGGSNPLAVVNAPQQYVGYAATPSPTAIALADAIQNGTLSQYGTVGNAVNFQSGPTAAANGLTAGPNIGGNYFSDKFGAPTPNFVAPSLGTSQIAAGDPSNASSGIAAGSGAGSTAGPAIDPATGMPATLTDAAANAAGAGAGTGSQITVGLQKSLVGDIQGWITQIAKGVWSGVYDSIASSFGAIQNWFVRAFVIIVGLVILAIGLIKLSGHDVTTVIERGAELAAA
jgi:hypothetical protein